MKTPTTTNNFKCPKCGHDVHKQGDCNERICDAAGDMDYCPCQMGLTISKECDKLLS